MTAIYAESLCNKIKKLLLIVTVTNTVCLISHNLYTWKVINYENCKRCFVRNNVIVSEECT